MFGLIVLAIVAAAGAALVLAARLERSRLQRRVRLEISNRGNVRSRYHLRAEGCVPDELLDCRFLLGGEALAVGGPLAVPAGISVEPGLQEKAGAAGRKANEKLDRAVGRGGAIADGLATLGSMLPTSIGGPLLRKAATLQRGRMQIRQVQRVPAQAAQLRALVPARRQHAPAGAGAQAPAPAGGEPGWAETPAVRPGETLAVDLLIHAAPQSRGRACSFRLVTRSAEEADAPLVAAEGSVQVGGGFWSHRSLSFAVILAIAIALLLLAAWLAAQGILTWTW